MEYTIEKDVPVPKNLGRPPKYPWKKLDISVMVDGELIGTALFISDAKIGSIISIAGSFGKNNNMKFTCRTVDGGVRVWRIA